VPADGEDLGAKAVSYGIAHMNGNRHLELGGRCGEGFDLLSRPLERSAEVGGLGLPFGCRRDSRSCSFQGGFVHRRRGYPHSRMDTALLDYELPEELIAQHPAEQRDASRLLVYRRATGAVDHRVFFELPELLAGELVVVNDTRVVPARLRLERETGGAVELLLVERCDGDGLWQGLVRPSRRVRTGERLGPVELLEELGDGRWLLRLEGEPAGEAPLPPYIRQHLDDAERYQTVYAREAGSAAAPTAGLHFTDELLQRVDHERVTLHVGLDTFRPIAVPQVEDHAIHGERYSVEQPAWERIASADRVLAVGTTCVRVLETVVRTGELAGRTSLFVTPGFRFRRVDALLTNFHLPRSTLLALVMAFAGVDEVRELYRLAAQKRYRFYSFGDAMLIL
jgi:S-adenosylmethionine:tRNA ribosyltransferase-isomerase